MKLSAILLCLLSAVSALHADFPIGIYQMDPAAESTYEHIKGIFNYTQSYMQPADAKFADKVRLAEQYGLKMLIPVLAKNFREKSDYMDEVRELVLKYKESPCLGMWYLYDEPEGAETREILTEVYKLLKKETPGIPVALCIAWTKDYPAFKNCADILMPDYYPVKNEVFPEAKLNLFAQFIWNVSRLGKDIMPIAQLMNWKGYPEAMAQKNIDPATCRYPSAAEIRYCNFAAMAMNIKGMFYYSFYNVWRDKQIPYLEQTAGPAIRELRDFAEQVNGTEFTALTTPIGKGNLPDYLAASWVENGDCRIVLVNNTATELIGNFTLQQSAGSGKLIPWGKTRDVKASVQGKTLKLDKLAPWEVMVWQLK